MANAVRFNKTIAIGGTSESFICGHRATGPLATTAQSDPRMRRKRANMRYFSVFQAFVCSCLR